MHALGHGQLGRGGQTKTGRTLQELAAEIERQKQQKRDFVGPTTGLEMALARGSNADIILRVGRDKAFDVNDLAHEQVADRLEIPRRYYNRMLDAAPALLAENVNHWFRRGKDTRLVRTLDGRCRAFLSDRYRPMDNADLAEAVLPSLLGREGLRVESCEITDRRLYLQVVNERVQAEVKKGDVVQAGVLLSNSEVGCGCLAISPLVFRLVCLNGAVMSDGALRKYHAGKQMGGGDEMLPWERLTDETRQATDKAMWLQGRDLCAAALDEAVFAQAVSKMRDATLQKLEAGPTEVVEVVDRRYGLREGEKTGVLQALIEGADLSRWGLANAVTRASHDVKDYDRAIDLERLGGQIIELPPASWAALSAAKN